MAVACIVLGASLLWLSGLIKRVGRYLIPGFEIFVLKICGFRDGEMAQCWELKCYTIEINPILKKTVIGYS